jgi:hypothetical protein
VPVQAYRAGLKRHRLRLPRHQVLAGGVALQAYSRTSSDEVCWLTQDTVWRIAEAWFAAGLKRHRLRLPRHQVLAGGVALQEGPKRDNSSVVHHQYQC